MINYTDNYENELVLYAMAAGIIAGVWHAWKLTRWLTGD